MSTKKLLIVTPEERNAILGLFNKNEALLTEDVEILQNWMKTQKHLPEVMSKELITRFLLNNKFSIEISKEKIDMYYTIRSLIPELYENSNPKLPEMQNVLLKTYICPLPKLLDHCRINIVKLKSELLDDNEKIDIDKFHSVCFSFLELRCIEGEMSISEINIFDLKGLKLSHISNLTPMSFKRMATVLEKVWSDRIKAVHFVNYPPFLDKILGMLKLFLKPKLYDRIQLHKDQDSIMKYFDKKILPKDYGGDEMSLDEIQEGWLQKFKEYQPKFDALDKLRVNENLRDSKLTNDELLGFHGNFKKLSVD
ncbi:unnamed protein product [Brassicogethes aeneus]|uniref:CRAL-TRIO domain-containing protein n=1 Tax=Brassicogethes aeneus TaxID=1431903 RepID=A0A9P0FBQ3_BRAAE|nr:unnamed protein product [Brassicogethes aeneus]